MTPDQRQATHSLALELQLYAEDHYGAQLPRAAILTAFLAAVANVAVENLAEKAPDVALNVEPVADQVVNALVESLRQMVTLVVTMPERVTAREVLARFQAHPEGKSWVQ